MCSSDLVGPQNLLIEILDTQTEAADASLFDHLQLTFGQRSRLALKSDLLRFIPRQQPLHGLHDPGKLAGRNVGGSSTSKVDELRLAAADEGLLRVERQLLDGG